MCNLSELVHGGRPKDEEPHVKKSLARKDGDGIEYILRVNLVCKDRILWLLDNNE